MKFCVQYDKQTGFISGTVSGTGVPTALPAHRGQLVFDSEQKTTGKRVNLKTLTLEDDPVLGGTQPATIEKADPVAEAAAAEWTPVFEATSAVAGYSPPESMTKAFDTFFNNLGEKTAPETVDSIRAVHRGIAACFYHLENIQSLERKMLKEATTNLPNNPKPFNGAFGGGNTGKITMEFQAFILAEKHLLEYFAKSAILFLKLEKIRDFSDLEKALANPATDTQRTFKAILDKYIASLKPIYYVESGQSLRNKISHRGPFIHDQIGLSVGPQGAVAVYFRQGQIFETVGEMDYNLMVPLVTQKKGYVFSASPLTPTLSKRFDQQIAFILEGYEFLLKEVR